MSKRNSDSDPVGSILKSIAKMVIGIFSSIYLGWVFSVVWGWFAVAYLGLPAITLLGGISVGIVYGALASPLHLNSFMAAGSILKNDPEEAGAAEVISWIGPALVATVVLIGGAFWHFGMFPLMIALGAS